MGRLLEHGAAPYEYRPDNNLSYFAKIQTERGTRTLWGKDLSRAITAGESRPKIGDIVGARRASWQAVESKNYRPSDPIQARTHWQVEKIQLFVERAKQARVQRDTSLHIQQSMRARPELKSTFLSMRAAELLAEKRIPDPESRQQFLALLREAIGNSVHQNKPLPDIPMRDHLRINDSPARASAGRDDEPTRRHMSEVIFRDAKLAFKEALSLGRLSSNPAVPHFVGHYMYMGTTEQGDLFKHVSTREYLPFPKDQSPNHDLSR